MRKIRGVTFSLEENQAVYCSNTSDLLTSCTCKTEFLNTCKHVMDIINPIRAYFNHTQASFLAKCHDSIVFYFGHTKAPVSAEHVTPYDAPLLATPRHLYRLCG